MSGQTIAAIVMAACMLTGMLAALISLSFKIGTLSGQVLSFMRTNERDRAEALVQSGKLEAMIQRHIETHEAKK